MIQLKLFSTLGCHLCEEAEQILIEVAQHTPVQWRTIEIASDPRLIDRYGIKIPVVQLETTAEELGWPFDAASLSIWLNNSRSVSAAR